MKRYLGKLEVKSVREGDGSMPMQFAVPGVTGEDLTALKAHHPIQLVRPDIPFFADENPAAACVTRQRLLAQCADSDVVLFPAHFPDPPAGRVRRAPRFFSYDFFKATGT